MAFMSDSTLFNTREGRAGKVHNFMLGLNLNTSYPLSPFRDFTTQESLDDDELDAAVAGKYTEENPHYKNMNLIGKGLLLFFWGKIHWTGSGIVMAA